MYSAFIQNECGGDFDYYFIFKETNFIIFNYMCLCIPVWVHKCGYRYLWRPETSDPPGGEVTGICLDVDPLQELYMHLSSGLSLQNLFPFLSIFSFLFPLCMEPRKPLQRTNQNQVSL